MNSILCATGTVLLILGSCASAQAKNPNMGRQAVVAQPTGEFKPTLESLKQYKFPDQTSHGGNTLTVDGDWIHGEKDKAIGKPRWTAEELSKILRNFEERKAVPIFNLRIHQEGGFPPASIELFKQARALRGAGGTVTAPSRRQDAGKGPEKALPIDGQTFAVEGHTAFVIMPRQADRKRPTPWVWYAPTLPGLPEGREKWMFEKFLDAGMAIAGVDVGESYGSPAGRAIFAAFYKELVEKRGFAGKACLLARSRGGLMHYNWACENPKAVACIAGIYPVCNLRSYPGLDNACDAYGLTAAQLEAQLAEHNPMDRLAALAKAGVPIFHVHGDSDAVVPLEDNSGALARRYRELGGTMRLRIAPGQGHNVWEGFFQCDELVEFVLAHASPAAERDPSPALFQNPPLEARPGAFWDWLNGNVDLAELTRELEEMKAKGMSGAEIWDVGVINPNPAEPIQAGPPFLGPESLNAINHAIDQADRLGLRLGLVASSSWNAGGSWVTPRDAMKGLYHSETTVTGPSKLSQVLPFPANKAPKGADGLPLYYKEVAVLAFPQSPGKVVGGVASILDLSGVIDSTGLLTWDVPPGQWVIVRFVLTNTGQKLVVPSPNSDGLIIDHLDAQAAERHFRYIMDQILKTRPSFDALKYMEVDSVEVDPGTDWTETFVAEFRRRRGYDPTPCLPALAGWSFADPQIAPRFLYDYRKTVSDLWIDGHYRKSTEVLNRYGLQLAAEAGHGGYPRTEPLGACGVTDIPRGEFWNGSQFWCVKEVASAAHIYGRQIVDAESFTGWRHWQDGPLEYKRLADTAFCAGLNRLTFHTFAHEPPRAGLPGQIYHAGEHINVNSTWWSKAGPLFSYFSRCCYLLQQGLSVGDVCYYYGDDAPNLVATRRIGPDPRRLDGATCAHCGRPNPAPADALGTGYDYDVVNSEVILTRMEVKNGRLVLPDGLSYAVLVLPERQDMPLAVLEKIERLVREGATVLGPKPSKSPSLTDYPRCDERVRTLADRVWGNCDGKSVRERSYGKGQVVWDRNRARETLQRRGIGPDFAFDKSGKHTDLDYIHRRTPGADVFFVSNTQMEDVETDCVFRVAPRRAQLWFPDTGEIQSCAACERVAGGAKLKLRLPPAGSVFVVFAETAAKALPPTATREPANMPAPLELTGSWEVKFPPNLGAPPSRIFEKLVSWTSDPDEGIKYFSGTATYLKEFEVPASMLADGCRLELDLGQLRNVADATLNAKHLGIRWKPPFTYDVTGIVRSGKNQLAVEITNLWANRLVGDAALPKEKRITRLTQIVPIGGPLESGLFGPVQLRASSPPVAAVQAGFFTPARKGQIWDTWVYYHEGRYYMYYLAGPGGHWDGHELAISEDGVHWKEYGVVVKPRDGVTWMGTGHIWKSPDFDKTHKWVMNYSEWFGDKQDIMFVTSTDLLHWTKVAEKHRFVQDIRWYKEKGRWDCIDAIQRPDGGLYGYFTADPEEGKVTYRPCGFGFAESKDGITWTALAPVEGDIGGEFGGIQKIGDKYYILISEGRVAVGDKPEGPFLAQKKNPNAFGAGCDIYFPRFFHTAPGGPLVNHFYSGGTVYAAPLKDIEIDREGILRLKWWKNNDSLKAKPVKTRLVVASSGYASSMRMLDAKLNLSRTHVIEGTLGGIQPPQPAGGKHGIFFEQGDGLGQCLLLARDAVRFGEIKADGSDLKILQTSNRDMDLGPVLKFRLVIKGDMMELYVNDYLMNLKRVRCNGRIGFMGADDAGAFKSIRVWQSK